jgi:hypothetical protein
MTQDPPGSNSNGSLNGRLDGWKDIAAYLGRGVRTAQRWERELGLPVRRLGTGGAEVVYALRDEVDAWLLKQSRLPTAQPQDEVETARAAERHGLGVWAGPAGLVLMLGLLGGWMLLRSPRPAQSFASAEPAELEVVGNNLNVRGVDRELLWSHPFELPLEDFDPSTEGGKANLRRLTSIGDFRGTGRSDVLLARNTHRDPQLYWFDHAGSLVRTHRAYPDVSFGSHRCTNIRFTRLFTHMDAAEPRAFWLTGHDTSGLFPSLLQGLDASGRVDSEYWSAGFIISMAVVRRDGRRLILVGSAANETAGAALAVFDGAAVGSSPAADSAYRCAGCPPGTPTHYFVFPRSRIQAELGGNAFVFEILDISEGKTRVRVVQAGGTNPGEPTGSAYYTFDAGFRLVDAELDPYVEVLQRKYEAEHLVSSATRPRGDADLYPILRWNGNGYDRISGPETR